MEIPGFLDCFGRVEWCSVDVKYTLEYLLLVIGELNCEALVWR